MDCDVDRAILQRARCFGLPGAIIGLFTNFHRSWQFRRSSRSNNGSLVDDASVCGRTLASVTDCLADVHGQ